MGKEYVTKCIADIEVLAKEEGLDFFPTIFETVDRDIMLEACSYGLPVRARHWSYGRSYQHQPQLHPRRPVPPLCRYC